MNGAGDEWQRFVAALVLTLFFAGTLWLLARRRKRPDVVPDEAAGTPYRIYSLDFDQVVTGDALPALLGGATTDRARRWATTNDKQWHTQIEAAEALWRAIPDADPAQSHLRDIIHRHPADWALTILVDMSGSMRGDPVIQVAAQVRWLCESLTAHDVPVALLGFSTMGWHGGKAAQAWISAGKPSRPGRLCSLLHMAFKDFDAPFSASAWHAMLHPDALRENVDGEALMWAADTLKSRAEPRKLLIILSDGAPVDDTTFTYNGPSYLIRHLLDRIGAIMDNPDMSLGAIGVGYAVDRYYPISASVSDLATLAPAMVDMIGRLLDAPNSSVRTMH